MTSRPEDASLPHDPAALEALFRELEAREQKLRQRIAGLMAGEQAGQCHAAAIHEAKQTVFSVTYQKELCRNRLNRLRSQEPGF